MHNKRDDPASWSRSYRRRQGKASRRQREALRELWPALGLDCPWDRVLEPAQIFGREAPFLLELGFGKGENLVAQAEQRPDWNILGVEVHRPGIGAALLSLHEAGLENARVLRHEGLLLLAEHLQGRPLDEVHIFFPEPWPREKDAHRRLVRPLLLSLLEERMRPGALLRLATDVRSYAEAMLALLQGREAWENQAPGGGFCERYAGRPVTKYEGRGLQEGRATHDLCFELRQPATNNDATRR